MVKASNKKNTITCGVWENNLKQSITCSGAKFIVTSITAGNVWNYMQANKFMLTMLTQILLSALNTWKM